MVGLNLEQAAHLLLYYKSPAHLMQTDTPQHVTIRTILVALNLSPQRSHSQYIWCFGKMTFLVKNLLCSKLSAFYSLISSGSIIG